MKYLSFVSPNKINVFYLFLFGPRYYRHFSSQIFSQMKKSQLSNFLCWILHWIPSMIISTFIIVWCWSSTPIHVCIINTLRSRQDGCHFPENIFKRICLSENVWISIDISLNFVPKGSINNIPALVQIMGWHWSGHYLNQWSAPRNKLHFNFNRNSCIFMLENPFENVVWKLAVI